MDGNGILCRQKTGFQHVSGEVMTRSLVHKLLLARRLHTLSRENLSSANDLSLSIGVNLLQDSVEAFLLAIAEHVNAQIQLKTAFDQYFDLIDAKITPKVLPFRARLIALNKLRVNSKHFGLAPAKSEVSGLLVTVREFFDEVTSAVLGVSFSTLSLTDLLRDGEAKDFLKDAEAAFNSGDFEKCLFGCRKAIFVRFEADYDLSPFEHDDAPNSLGLVMLGRKLPFYARNKEYVSEHVHDPTDYIMLDHNGLEMELMKSGMDTVSFWNVWRLTPQVYRSEKGKPWIEKRDFRKLEQEGIEERSEYVLDTTINLLVSADQKIAEIRQAEYRGYFANLRREHVSVYRKASLKSDIVDSTPAGLRKIYVDFIVPALDGDGKFWHLLHYDEDVHLSGYISQDEIE